MTKKRIISFSLWGDNPKYTIGAIKNAELAPTIYLGWTCRFCTADDVPPQILSKSRSVKLELAPLWSGLFWRFYAAGDPEAEAVIVRDTDSRLNWREQVAVAEWLQSDRTSQNISAIAKLDISFKKRRLDFRTWILCNHHKAWGSLINRPRSHSRIFN